MRISFGSFSSFNFELVDDTISHLFSFALEVDFKIAMN